MTTQDIKQEIFRKICEYYNKQQDADKFIPGKSKIHYAGRVYNEEEMILMTDAVLDFWLTLGKYGNEFEYKFSDLLGVKNVLLTNSGSSANLIAISSLKSVLLKNRLKDGDEVITTAATFPTTFNPIIQNNLLPVLVDVEQDTYNLDAEILNDSLSDRTKAIVIPHTLGNPNQMDVIMDFAEDHALFVIEDACDALGSTYDGRLVGTFGTFGTFSFYPAHHITMGEGGAVASNEDVHASIALSIRDWGRACVCKRCQLSVGQQCPLGFQVESVAKYLYTNIGYNLKPTDIQAALGVAQLKKLPDFIKKRKQNFKKLYNEFQRYEDYFILPESLPKADPCWFAFPLTVKKNSYFTRQDIITWYEKSNIETRPLFAGNIIRQPGYKEIKYRISQNLENTDLIMRNTFFLGTYPGIDEKRMDYMLEKTYEFMTHKTRG
jgi:CDP-6-deoxy-D-xylo-4-hexulose-3-dehydrase